MEEKRNYPIKVKDVWMNPFYMPFIVVSGFFVFVFAIGFTLIDKIQLQGEFLKDGLFIFFVKRFVFSSILGIILTMGITLISGFIVYFSTKDKREPIAVFKASLIFNFICILIGSSLFVYAV